MGHERTQGSHGRRQRQGRRSLRRGRRSHRCLGRKGGAPLGGFPKGIQGLPRATGQGKARSRHHRHSRSLACPTLHRSLRSRLTRLRGKTHGTHHRRKPSHGKGSPGRGDHRPGGASSPHRPTPCLGHEISKERRRWRHRHGPPLRGRRRRQGNSGSQSGSLRRSRLEPLLRSGPPTSIQHSHSSRRLAQLPRLRQRHPRRLGRALARPSPLVDRGKSPQVRSLHGRQTRTRRSRTQ